MKTSACVAGGVAFLNQDDPVRDKHYHAAVSVHHDGSGSITIYTGSGTPKVRKQGRISFNKDGFRALLEFLKERDHEIRMEA